MNTWHEDYWSKPTAAVHPTIGDVNLNTVDISFDAEPSVSAWKLVAVNVAAGVVGWMAGWLMTEVWR